MLKNKSVFLILLVLLFLFFCNGFSYGVTSCIPSSVSISDEGLINAIKSNQYYNNDNYWFFSGFQYGNRSYWYAFVEKKSGVQFYMVPENDYQGYKYYHIEASEPVQVYRYKYGSSETLNDISTFIITLTSNNVEDNICYLECFANSNIYNSDGSVFFQLPPPMAILMTPMEVEEIPTLITKLLIILVPIGLTIFGALLLVYLLHSKNWLHL